MTRNLKQNPNRANAAKSILISSLCALTPLSATAESLKTNPPPIKSTTPPKVNKTNLEIARSIYGVMEPYQLTHDIDKRSVDDGKSTSQPSLPITGKETLIEQIAQFVKKGETIPIAMIGFPFKSTNTDHKVIGHAPDMAERHALKHINAMLLRIRDIYPHGATFQIISDGSTFNDILGISDTIVEAYEDALKTLASDLKDIQIITSRELKVTPSSSMANLRQAIKFHSPSLQEFEEMVAKDASMRYELDVIKKRLALELDHQEGQEILNLLADKESTSDPLLLVSKKIIVRSRQIGKFISSKFFTTPYLKFSVH